MTKFEIVAVPVLADNYVWVLHDEATSETLVIDPGVAAPVIAETERRGWAITQVWNTHWHPDHTGGNAEIKAASECPITGPLPEAAKIPTLDHMVGEGDRVAFARSQATVFEVPGHTAGHIAFHFPDEALVFVGDTLFAMGCGRLFEGDANQMFANMQRFATLPGETLAYPAHEYTQSNGRFALVAEPDNAEIVARMRDVDALRARGEPTLPTTISIERATNPFLRAEDASRLAALRSAKDAFRG